MPIATRPDADAQHQEMRRKQTLAKWRMETLHVVMPVAGCGEVRTSPTPHGNNERREMRCRTAANG